MNGSDASHLDWSACWRRQLGAIVRLELRRNLLAPRGLWVVALAFAPAVLVGLHAAFVPVHAAGCSVEGDSKLVAWLLLVFQLRVAIYFGLLGVFVQSFRGEMVDKTLHYALIAPVRRELLVLGKFLAASAGGVVLFGAGVLTCFVLLGGHHGSAGIAYSTSERGLREVGAHLGLTILACLGYGAVFLTLTRIFRNPVLAAIAFFGWESISALLPTALQFLSVTFYLKPLFPVDLPTVGISGLLTATVEPIPPLVAVIGLIFVSSVAVTTVAVSFRRLEIDAGD